MQDYTYPSIFLTYLLFAIFLAGALFFFIRSFKDGYWGEKGEEVKYRMLDDEETENVE